MDTVNAKKRWMNIKKFLKERRDVTCLANERASLLKVNDNNDISFFLTSDCYPMIGVRSVVL
jgi:hypothetical protein